jgi:hypothetical protein
MRLDSALLGWQLYCQPISPVRQYNCRSKVGPPRRSASNRATQSVRSSLFPRRAWERGAARHTDLRTIGANHLPPTPQLLQPELLKLIGLDCLAGVGQ